MIQTAIARDSLAPLPQTALPRSHRRTVRVYPTWRGHAVGMARPQAVGTSERIPLDSCLSIKVLRPALGGLYAHGYRSLEVAGGEPLAYPHLPALLERAMELGMTTTIISDGSLLDERRLERLGGLVDQLFIKVAGQQASHDRLYGLGTFNAMRRRLEDVRRSGIRFGFVFTLTQHNVHELAWLARFAVSHGASSLHIQALGPHAELQAEPAAACPDEREVAFAYLAAQQASVLTGRSLRIAMDFTEVEQLRQQPELALAGDRDPLARTRQLADILSPLVIEPDGTVVPLKAGLARDFRIGNLYHKPFNALVADWRESGWPLFRALCRWVHKQTVTTHELPFIDWPGALYRAARVCTTRR